jgi:hypothetical protein
MSADDGIITLEQFAAVDWQGPLVGTRKVDAGDLADLFAKAAKGAEASGQVHAEAVFWLLFHVCNIMLDTSDRATPFRPRLVFADGRSAEPADYRGAQSKVFAALLPQVQHPGLKARLGDIIWTNDRRASSAAADAVEGYCEVVEGLLAERFDEAVPGFGRSTFEQATLAHRALQVGRATLKGNALPERAKSAAMAVYERARVNGEHVVFMQIATVMANYGLLSDADIGKDAEDLAGGDFKAGHEMAVQGVWDFAAKAHAAAKDAEAERRCRLQSVDMTLRRARSASSAMVSAHFLRVAIEALRRTRDTKEQRDALLLELRECQLAARDEFVPSQHSIDIQELVKASLEALGKGNLADLLRAFTQVTRLSDPKDARDEALEALSSSPFGSLFGSSHADIDGKTIAETSAHGLGGVPTEERIDEQISQAMGLSRQLTVSGTILPVRDAMISRFAFAERHFWPIVELSPFVPPDQAALFSLGFARFLQGDMMSAAHLLLPQIEPSLRHVLLNNGFEPTIIKSDMLQEDQTLAPLLTNFRSELEGIFGPEIVFEIDVLFNKRPGPRLRHDFAHGKVSAGRCFSPDVVYACWLMFHISAFPLLEHWDDTVVPALDRIECDPGALRRKG